MPKGTATPTTILSDTGGRCVAPTPTCVHMSRRGRCTSWSTPALPASEAQARTCKYDGGSVAAAPGPNALCDSRAILPLTEHKSAVEAVLTQMRAKGSTNILDGRMWGWRMLSPEEPLTEGRPYSDPENNMYLILMTDGENNQIDLPRLRLCLERQARGHGDVDGPHRTDEQQDARRLRERQGRRASPSTPSPSGSKTMPTRAPCWRAAPRVRRKPTRQATEPP
jgi:hypothetical protein